MTRRMGIVQNPDEGESVAGGPKQYSPSNSTKGKRTPAVATLRHQLGRPVDVVLLPKTADCVKRIQRGGDKERFDMAVVAYTLSELQVRYMTLFVKCADISSFFSLLV